MTTASFSITAGQTPSVGAAVGIGHEVPLWIVGTAFVVLMIVVPIVGVWLWTWFHRRGGHAHAGRGQAGCGTCGYPVRGLSSFICPECGADLREVGILAGRGPLQFGVRVWNALMWLAMWIGLAAAYGGVMLFIASGPRVDMLIVPGLIWASVAAGIGILFMFRPQGHGPGRLSPPVLGSEGESPSPPQPRTTVTRNLSIMFIDIEGYTSRTAGASRDGVIALIRQARDLVQPEIARHHGRIIKTMGDGLLATFESPTEAVLAGRDIQREAGRRASGPDDGPAGLRLRVGITTGEVALEDDDVFGDPVNLAARIQQLAPAGQVYFSESTWHAMTRSEVPHTSAGEFEMKGIDRPVNLYRAEVS